MFNRNQVVLIIISVVTLSLSGVLFYQGLKSDLGFKNEDLRVSNEKSEIVQSTQVTTSPAILGEKQIPNDEEKKDSIAALQNDNKFRVSKVVDGDTIEVWVGDQTISVRFIGINTPETVDPRKAVECFGKEASNEAKRLLEGKEVILEKDITDKDKYQRLLRYIYLPLSDGTLLFVNDYLVRQGFAQVYTYPPDVKFDKRFREAEIEAKDNLRGLWGKCQ